MSAICGVFQRNRQAVDPRLVERMVNVLAHWEPDQTAFHCDQEVGLGHLMLWNTPESFSESQPLRFKQAGLSITAAARIDNRSELFEALSIHREEYSRPDSWLILKAYEKWGDACVDHLLGDFAFSVWDSKRRQLFCARDFLGAKPFYYFESPEVFVFATEIKAILLHPAVAREINEIKVAEYAIGMHEDQESTWYRNIHRLPPATTLRIGAGSSSRNQYWKPEDCQEVRHSSSGDYVEHWKELLSRAVRSRLRSAYPIGAEQSGGLDSNAIIASANMDHADAIAKPPFHTWSWALEQDDPWQKVQGDERADVLAMLHHLRDHNVELKHSFATAIDRNLFTHPSVERLMQWHDGPCTIPNHFVICHVHERANRANVRTLLSGYGGDELASSHAKDALLGLFFSLRWDRLWDTAGQMNRHRGGRRWSHIHHQVGIPIVDWLRGKRRRSLRQLTALSPTTLAKKFGVRATFLKSSGTFDHLQKQIDYPHFWCPDPLRAFHRFIYGGCLFQRQFENKWQSSLLQKIEYRFPLLDRRLVDFCLGIPSFEFIRGGFTRRLMREGTANYIPDCIRLANKRGVAHPDTIRRIRNDGAFLQQKLNMWRQFGVIADMVDLDILEKKLKDIQQTEDSKAVRMPGQSNFCRLVYISLWLEHQKVVQSKL